MKRYLFSFCLPLSLFSLPLSPLLQTGEASFHPAENRLEIRSGDFSQIDWDSFSIDAHESVHFSQPNAQALAINRVLSAQPSELMGRLEANGQIVLINPNGVLVGREAMIDTGSFIASTLDLQRDFKKFCFTGSSTAKLTNLGSVIARSGDIAFIAGDIDNQGPLEAMNGSIALIGSTYRKEFECVFPAERMVSRITQSNRLMSPGGKIHLTADEIYIFGSSHLETSSNDFGGEIIIGAGYQGKDPDFTNAKMIWVDKEARIFADSWENGSGGTVILFSDGYNAYEGMISATGGKLSGDGGFVEVSGHVLSYLGLADLRSTTGKSGTLLLDPVNITIDGSASPFPASVVEGVNFCNFAAGCCSACPPCATLCPGGGTVVGFHAAPAGNTTIGVAQLNLQLDLGSIILDSTVGAGGAGNITWGAGNPLTVTVAGANHDLFLRASGVVTIRSNVQNPNAGAVGRMIIESTAAGNAVVIDRVAFGSRDALTQVCAPNGTVFLSGGGGTAAQIGFYPTVAGASAGPITVSCNALNLTAGVASSSAQIGHGQPNSAGGATVANSTTAAAVISVNSNGNIDLNASNQGVARIGHGNYLTTGAGAANDQNGNITVISRAGTITLRGSASQARIGHGVGYLVDTAAGSTLSGNIAVSAPAGNISLLTGINGQSLIGHGSINTSAATSINGNIEVYSGNDLNITPITDAGIGSGTAAATVPTIIQNIRVAARQDINMSGRLSFIGSAQSTTRTFSSGIEVVAGRNISMTNPITLVLIGVGRGSATVTTNADVFVAAGQDIIMTGVPGATNVVIEGGRSVSVAAGRDVTLSNPGTIVAIGTYRSPAVGTPTVSIRANGNIRGINTTAVNPQIVRFGNSLNLITNFNLDMRAGGDIQFPNILAAGTGFIFIEADANYPLGGELWTVNGGFNSINGNPLPLAITETCVLGGLTAASSVASCANGTGAFRFDPTFSIANHIMATTNNFTLHSAPLRADGTTLQNLIVETVATSVDSLIFGVATPNNFEVSGSICSDGFNDITVNPMTGNPTGNILFRASRDLIINASAPATGTNSITLISDCGRDGVGTVFLNTGLTAADGPITIIAGTSIPVAAGPPICMTCTNLPCPLPPLNSTASIIQSTGQIITLTGQIDLNAQADITLSGSGPTCVLSGSGNINAIAGGIVTINQPIATGVNGQITILSDRDQATGGDVVLNNNVTSDNGNITINAGILNGTCTSQFCLASNSNIASIQQNMGAITSTTGSITLLAQNTILLNPIAIPPFCVNTTGGAIQCFAGNDILIGAGQHITGAGPLAFVAGRDMMIGADGTIVSPSPITIVVDNNFPIRPFFGNGAFTMAAGSAITAPQIEIFTSLQSLNSIAGTLNATGFTPGTLFEDTNLEQWCTYFSCSPQTFFPGLGIPYTVFYKPCLQLVTMQAMEIVDEFLTSLHPFNEFPGWVARFEIQYDIPLFKASNESILEDEPYFLRRRNLNLLNHPKTWTVWMAE